MSKGKGRVRVETNQESPRSYDVSGGEEVTIRTRHEKPDITFGGGGGGGLDFTGCLAGFTIVCLLIFGVIRGCTYVVETHIIKTINPNYVTSFEKAEKEEKEIKIKKREEEKKKETELAEKEMVHRAIQKSPKNRSRDFILVDYCVIDNYVWACGSVSGKVPHWPAYSHGTATEHYPAVMISEDGGINYTILWEKPPIYANINGTRKYYASKIRFLDKNNGFMELVISISGKILITMPHKTSDGGISWKEIP
jgi:hypothetical protein